MLCYRMLKIVQHILLQESQPYKIFFFLSFLSSEGWQSREKKWRSKFILHSTYCYHFFPPKLIDEFIFSMSKMFYKTIIRRVQSAMSRIGAGSPWWIRGSTGNQEVAVGSAKTTQRLWVWGLIHQHKFQLKHQTHNFHLNTTLTYFWMLYVLVLFCLFVFVFWIKCTS